MVIYLILLYNNFIIISRSEHEKMRNLNRNGFALVETLVVSAFVMGIFTLLYTNYYPLIGEYEKRDHYDNIDMVYKTDVLKKFINKNRKSSTSEPEPLYYQNSSNFCKLWNNPDQCTEMWKVLKVKSILLTQYTIKNQKNSIKNKANISNGLKEYVEYLPDYSTNKYNYRGRIIVEYEEKINDADSSSYTVYKYATLGVDLYD